MQDVFQGRILVKVIAYEVIDIVLYFKNGRRFDNVVGAPDSRISGIYLVLTPRGTYMTIPDT